MENLHIAQFPRNFEVGPEPRKLKSEKYFTSLSKVKAIIHIAQFPRNFEVGPEPRKLKSEKYFTSLSKVKAIIHKHLRCAYTDSATCLQLVRD